MTAIVTDLENALRPGTVIPKPNAQADFIVKGWGARRGQRALIYNIPNHKVPTKPYEKGITGSEWEQAFERLTTNGDFSRQWFNRFMPAWAKEGGCNFTTIGGVFVLLGHATYDHGVYQKQEADRAKN